MTRDEIRNVLGCWYHKTLFQPLLPNDHVSDTVPGAAEGNRLPWEGEREGSSGSYRLYGGLAPAAALWQGFFAPEQTELFTETKPQETVLYTLGLDAEGRYLAGSFRFAFFPWAIAQLAATEDESQTPVLDPESCRELNRELDSELALAAPVFTVDMIIALTQSLDRLLFGELNSRFDREWYQVSEDAEPLVDPQLDKPILHELRQAAGRFGPRDPLLDFVGGVEKLDSQEQADLSKVSFWKQHLAPLDYPLVQWPAAQDLNLSQQWIVNRSAKPSARGDISTFQAPTGSGREKVIANILANQILRRAELLSTLAKPSDAFTMRRFLYPPNDNSGNFYVPILELVNGQMLLTAEETTVLRDFCDGLNNANQVDRTHSHSDSFDLRIFKEVYFTEVGRKVHGDQAWGLGAFYVDSIEGLQSLVKELLPAMSPRAACWSKIADREERLLSWEEAKMRFQRLQDKLRKKQDSLQEIFKASEECAAIEIEKETVQQRIRDMEAELERLRSAREGGERDLQTALEHLEGREADELAARDDMRGLAKFLYLFFKIGKYHRQLQNIQAHIESDRAAVAAHEEQLQQLNRRERDWQIKIEMLRKQLELKDRMLDERRPAVELMRAALGSNYADHHFYRGLDSEATQVACPWMDHEFAGLRERLFKAALDLQKSFVVHANEVSQNLRRLQLVLQGEFGREDREDALPSLLHTLQLIIPLTAMPLEFMSRLMQAGRKAENGTIVLLDAERNRPEDITGALWRANKTLAFGDLLQLARRKAPLSPLDEALCRSFGLPDIFAQPAYSAADYLLGAETQVFALGKTTVPFLLRLRESQQEPLFALDNQLCWYNKLAGTPLAPVTQPTDFLESSGWLDIGGICEPESLFVPIQADLLSDLLAAYLETHDQLPDLGIACFFPSVLEGFHAYTAKNWHKADTPFRAHHTAESLTRWVDEHTFLLHTWDGRVRDEVVFLTGADSDTPNHLLDLFISSVRPLHSLLNTARRRLLILGDPSVWASRPPLDRLFAALNDRSTPAGLGTKTLVFIRAGRSEKDEQGLMIGKSDTRLSEEGAAELQALANIAERYPQTDRYYSSSLIRGRETLPLLFPGKRIGFEHSNFNEVDLGAWESRALDSPEAQAFIQSWQDGEDLGPSYESKAALLARCQAAVDDLLNELERLSKKSATVVTHRVWLRTYFLSLAENAGTYPADLTFRHGGGFKAEFHRVGKAWKVGRIELLDDSLE